MDFVPLNISIYTPNTFDVKFYSKSTPRVVWYSTYIPSSFSTFINTPKFELATPSTTIETVFISIDVPMVRYPFFSQT